MTRDQIAQIAIDRGVNSALLYMPIGEWAGIRQAFCDAVAREHGETIKRPATAEEAAYLDHMVRAKDAALKEIARIYGEAMTDGPNWGWAGVDVHYTLIGLATMSAIGTPGSLDYWQRRLLADLIQGPFADDGSDDDDDE